MKKAAFAACLLFFTGAALFAGQQARNIELVDLPTANTMIKGEVRADVKLYPGGGILTRAYAGLFDRLMIGGAFNVSNLIGTGDVSFDVPKFLAKIRITDDDAAVPAISVGYEGQGYMDVPAKGAFAAVTKEVSLGQIFVQLTCAVYTDEFAHFGKDINAGAGAAFALTKEFVISGEYDGIIQKKSAHLNFGIGYFFDPIEIDVGLKYGLGDDTYRLARTLKILYISYF
jgi:hypothetical protein